MATTRVTVLDEPFGIRSPAPEEYTRAVAGHVDRTLRALRGASPALEPFPVAVLGAMEITDQLFRTREAAGAEVAAAVDRVERMSARVDRALAKSGKEDGAPRE
jgi:cell division protein ZapA (FtsZ GTPase activity inhibitor)